MPYIPIPDREELLTRPPNKVGELNYVIHLELFRRPIDELAIATIIDNYVEGQEPSYTLYNSVMGVLECVYWEFRCRKPEVPYIYHVALAIRSVQEWFYCKYLLRYEIEKRKLHGDVYPTKTKK